MNLHFLHINKTGGTAIKRTLSSHIKTGKYTLVFHGHHTPLRALPLNQKIFFILRHPVDRFLSGFHGLCISNRKHGFETPNELAEALADGRPRAITAMTTTPHLGERYVANDHGTYNWFHSIEYFESRKSNILLVGFLDTLVADFEKLKNMAGLPQTLQLPPVTDGKSNSFRSVKPWLKDDRHLSEKATEALTNWYQKDIEFYDYCKSIYG